MKMKIACVKTCGTLHFPEITLNNNNMHQQIREQLDEDVVFVNKHIVKGVVRFCHHLEPIDLLLHIFPFVFRRFRKY